jgi:hypothetical protein
MRFSTADNVLWDILKTDPSDQLWFRVVGAGVNALVLDAVNQSISFYPTWPISGLGSGLTGLQASNISGVFVNTTNQSSTFSGTNTWNGDIAHPATSAGGLAAGYNADSPTSTNYFIQLSGPTGNFTNVGIVGGRNGREIVLENATGYSMSFLNQSGLESTAANRIITGTGSGGVVTSTNNPGFAHLIYDSTQSRWCIQSITP